MTRPPHPPIPPGALAARDQLTAERIHHLRDLAHMARDHADGCDLPQCAGGRVAYEIESTCHRERDQLLFFAVAELAQLGYGTGGAGHARQ